MRHLRLLIITITAICVVGLGVLAFARAQQPPGDGDGDVIIIKGGSLDVQCGKNHGADCLGSNDNTGKYKHKQNNKHITSVVVKDPTTGTVFCSKSFTPANQPQINIAYK